MFGGMSYERLEKEKGLRWPCPDESHPGTMYLHERLWAEPRTGAAAPFSVVQHELPVELPDDEYPFLLTTGRRLAEYNTGVQTGGFTSPLRRSEAAEMHPDDLKRLDLQTGQPVRISSRRGWVVAPVGADPSLQPGMIFMTMHFQDEVSVNVLTIDATDPKAGTAEFKACAVKLEPLEAGAEVASRRALAGAVGD
jgi:formate dehydrogenase major subunit